MIKEYYPELDSLRGFAAMQVLIGHSILAVSGLAFFKLAVKPTNFIEHFVNSPIHFFWSDSQAVILFFVLSGFVLALPYYSERKTNPSYLPFFFKRIIRLYLPCFMVICISLFLRFLLYNPNILIDAGHWVKRMWSHPVDNNFLLHIFTLKPSYLDYVDRALWSLNPEIKLSLILPFFSLLIKKFSKIQSIGFLLIYVIIYHGLVKLHFQDLWPDFVTLYYLTYFLIGVVLCKYRDVLMRAANSSGWTITILLLIFAIYLYTFQFSAWWLYYPLYNIGNKITDQLASIGGSIILIYALSNKFGWLYNHRLSIYLGKLSFSIYLVHTIIITSFFYLFSSQMQPWLIVIISFISTFPIAWTFYILIEHPSALLSKKIYSILNKTFIKPKPVCK